MCDDWEKFYFLPQSVTTYFTRTIVVEYMIFCRPSRGLYLQRVPNYKYKSISNFQLGLSNMAMPADHSQRGPRPRLFTRLRGGANSYHHGNRLCLMCEGSGNVTVTGDDNAVGTSRGSTGNVCIVGDHNEVRSNGCGNVKIVGKHNKMVVNGRVDTIELYGMGNDVKIMGSVRRVKDRGSDNLVRNDRQRRNIYFSPVEEDVEEEDVEDLQDLSEIAGPVPLLRIPESDEEMEQVRRERNERRIAMDGRRFSALLPESLASPCDVDHKKTCAICIMEFQRDSRLKTLPCFHRCVPLFLSLPRCAAVRFAHHDVLFYVAFRFHKSCIDRWLTRQHRCPVCRHSLDRMHM